MKKNIYEIPCEYVWAYERESMLDPELVEEECEEWFETFITDEAEYEYGLRIESCHKQTKEDGTDYMVIEISGYAEHIDMFVETIRTNIAVTLQTKGKFLSAVS
jgi:hypothetical protein